MDNDTKHTTKYGCAEQYADNGAMDGYLIYKVEDGLQVGYAWDEETAREFVNACNAHDSLLAENAKLREALLGAKNWMHWANEKLGFGDEPLFPEWRKLKEALALAGRKDE